MTSQLTTAMLLGCAMACTSTEAPEVPEPPQGQERLPVAESAAAVDEPAMLATDGSYRLASSLDVEAQALLPPTAYDAVQTLEGLRDHPSQTLFALAEDAGVPAVGTIRDALPSALESRLDGWIDGYVRGITTGDGTLAQVLDAVLGVCHADVAAIRLDSRLAIAGASATHRLDTIELDVMDHALSFDVAPLAGIGAELEVELAVTVRRDGDAVTIALGDHGFGLPYGRIAWRATQDLIQARFGRDLRGLLGQQIDCAGLASYVANRCVLSVCVGHQSDLRSICEAGLDRAVSELQARIEAATFEPIALDAGSARLVDGADRDGQASAIEGGAWQARLDLGQGLRPAPAAFTGARE